MKAQPVAAGPSQRNQSRSPNPSHVPAPVSDIQQKLVIMYGLLHDVQQNVSEYQCPISCPSSWYKHVYDLEHIRLKQAVCENDALRSQNQQLLSELENCRNGNRQLSEQSEMAMSDLKSKLTQLAQEKAERDEALDVAASQTISHEEQIAALESKNNALHAAQSQLSIDSVTPIAGKRKRGNDGEQRTKKRASMQREELSMEGLFDEPSAEYTEAYLGEGCSTTHPDSH